MTNIKRGDVVLVWFPNSDLSDSKRRPALVVQADNLNAGLAQIALVMITSNLARRNHPSRIFIPLNSPTAVTAGLRTDSVIMTDNLATVLEKAIAAKLGRLTDMSAIDQALKVTLGLS
jgi:mRNA interferase MazF